MHLIVRRHAEDAGIGQLTKRRLLHACQTEGRVGEVHVAVAGDHQIVRAVEALALVGFGEHRLLTRGEVYTRQRSSSAVGEQQSTTTKRQAVRARLAKRSGNREALVAGRREEHGRPLAIPTEDGVAGHVGEEQVSVLAADPHGTFGPDVAGRDDLDAAFQRIGDTGKRHGGGRGLSRRAPHTASAHDDRTARRTQERASICFHPSTSQSVGEYNGS